MTASAPHDPLTVDIILPLDLSEDETAQRKAAARKLKVHPGRIKTMRLQKHSIDARKKDIKVQLRFEVGIDEALPELEPIRLDLPSVTAAQKTVIIVGSGPAGMFAALTAIERGWRPIVLERGKDASARRFDLAPIMRHGTVIEDSNYCFGEGGAGTFSDGKLYTRATKRGPRPQGLRDSRLPRCPRAHSRRFPSAHRIKFAPQRRQGDAREHQLGRGRSPLRRKSDRPAPRRRCYPRRHHQRKRRTHRRRRYPRDRSLGPRCLSAPRVKEHPARAKRLCRRCSHRASPAAHRQSPVSLRAWPRASPASAGRELRPRDESS